MFRQFLTTVLVATSTTLPTLAKDWLRYPAISPDGTTIVFTHGGDLYAVPSTGGEARQLTQHVKREFMPVWSPDSRTIAFASDRHGNYDVYTIPASGGAAKRLTWHSGHDLPQSFSADGKSIIFSATRVDDVASLDIPTRRMGEVYRVPIDGGEPAQLLTTPAEKMSIRGTRALYHDVKGYEDPWRKRHQSSVTRDLWLWDMAEGTHTRLTDFGGEDRNPVWIDDATYLYLSEQGGSFNVWKRSLNGGEARPITTFTQHPVRFLSRATSGLICYGFDGSIYTQEEGSEPQKVEITLRADQKENSERISFSEDITHMAVSPDGKEIAFVARGEVFATSVGHGTTRRITNTPEQERTVDFAPDGRTLVYSSERDGSWNLYTAKIAREADEHFYLATIIEEEPLLIGEDETFQPDWSPDGKSIAFLRERTQLCVIDVESKEVREIHDGSRIYSYTDGDIAYAWSPDSRHLLTQLLQEDRWTENIVLYPANGEGEMIDLTRSGYYDYAPTWAWNGEGLLWISNRHGQKAHGSWGYEMDVYAGFLTNRAYRAHRLSEEEREAYDEDEWKEFWKGELPLQPETVDQRIERLTIHSTDLKAYVMHPKKEIIYYAIADRGDLELWQHKLREGETSKLTGLGSDKGDVMLRINSDGDTIYALAGGGLSTIKTSDSKVEKVSPSIEVNIDRVAERAEIYDHIWRQTREKFHRPDFHGIDWDFYGEHYRQFLPAITNNYDFAEMLSELLGELDASHTGAFYRPSRAGADTAALGIITDRTYEGPGIKIAEVIARSPLALLDEPVPAGSVITQLNGTAIAAGQNISQLLDQKAGKRTLLTIAIDGVDEPRELVIKPISTADQAELLYHRWVDRMRAETERLSGGKIGYVHVRSMNDTGFRNTFNDVFGRYSGAKAIVVDTRFNGGGWLTEDLTTFLTGKQFLKFYPRGQKGMGGEPLFRWNKPSAVVMGEGNYSDAHLFPFAYKTLGIGKLVGMPVPGTGTAVWWERQIDSSLIFGIPQVSTIGPDGNYLENTQLEPDIAIANTPEGRAKGQDQQLKAAVEHLLSLPDAEPWPFPEIKN